MADIQVELEGVEELQRKLSTLSKAAATKIAKAAVAAGGDQIMNHARLNIHEVFSPKQSGGLSNSLIVASKISGAGAEAEIGPDANYIWYGTPNGQPIAPKVYARIHEFGGTVRPVHASSLHFVIDGKDIFTKKVTIPARPYLGPAAEGHVDEITKAMKEAVSDGIRDAI